MEGEDRMGNVLWTRKIKICNFVSISLLGEKNIRWNARIQRILVCDGDMCAFEFKIIGVGKGRDGPEKW